MRRILIGLVVALVAVLLTAGSSSPAWAVKAKKLSKKEALKYHTPFQFLTFEQLGNLEYSQRVKYVREFRKAMLDLESTQYMFRSGKSLTASLPAEDRDLYAALFFGKVAEAQTEVQNRGRTPISDWCIYGFNRGEYNTSLQGQRQAFECKPPANTRCSVASTGQANGVRCNPMLSGMWEKNETTCVTDQNSFRATYFCDQQRLANVKTGRDSGDVQRINKLAREYFKMGQNTGIRSTDLGERANGVIMGLIDNMEDDEATANLIYIASMYKKLGIPWPIKSSDGYPYSEITIEKLESTMNNGAVFLNKSFADYKLHCNSPVGESELKLLLGPNCMDSVKGKEHTDAFYLEKIRCDAGKTLAAERTSDPSRKILVKEILEIEECTRALNRIDSIEKSFAEVAHTYPHLQDDAPPGQPLPVNPPKPDTVVTSTGCNDNVVEEEHLLFQDSARCLACQVERSENLARMNEGTKDAPGYTVSKKWLSLVSTMALACGDGENLWAKTAQDEGKMHLSADKMLQYVQAFGHCDARTYDWDTYTGPMRPEDRDNIELWSNFGFWAQKDKDGKPLKTPPPDINKDFAKIYGISYVHATKIFCDPARFTKTTFTRKIKGFNPEFRQPSSAEFILNSRKRLSAHRTVTPDNKIEDSPADALSSCLDESLARAEKLYSGSKYCMATSDVGNANAWKQFRNDIENTNGNVIFNPAKCHVAKQIEATSTRKLGSFTDAEEISPTARKLRRLDMSILNDPPVNSDFLKDFFNTDQSDQSTVGSRRLSYSNPAACPAAPGSYVKASGSTAKKAKD